MDDLIITGSSLDAISSITKRLNTTFSLKDLGSLHYFLGIEVVKTNKSLLLCQQKYIRDLLNRAKMEDAKPISSLAEPQSRLLADADHFS